MWRLLKIKDLRANRSAAPSSLEVELPGFESADSGGVVGYRLSVLVIGSGDPREPKLTTDN